MGTISLTTCIGGFINNSAWTDEQITEQKEYGKKCLFADDAVLTLENEEMMQRMVDEFDM